MKIGVDLRALQVGHEYRGIGEVVRRIMNGVFALNVREGNKHEFIFFEYEGKDPKKFLAIPEELKYKEVYLGKKPLERPGRGAKQKFAERFRLLAGNPVPQAKGCDVFLQFDHALGVPRRPRSLVFAYDLIPLIYWNHYFTSAWEPFKNRALRTTLRTILYNYEHKRLIRRALRNARKVIAISQHTKNDLIKYFSAPSKVIDVVLLGASIKPLDDRAGEANKNIEFPTKPFLLFIGAAEYPRRSIDDLVAAYNNLKADGKDIQLVLAGENFQSPEGIPVPEARRAIMDSSYAQDILTIGYIDDATKQKLYKEAIAFVFPSNYEGFGLPILEAMLNSCPVITYKNSSIPEVGGDCVLYAKDWQDIWELSEQLMVKPKSERVKLIADAKKHAEKFTWDKTARTLYEKIISL